MLKLSMNNTFTQGASLIVLTKEMREDMFEDQPTMRYSHDLVKPRKEDGTEFRSTFCYIDGKQYCHVEHFSTSTPICPEERYFLVEEEKKPETDWDRFVKAQKEKEQQDRKAKRQAQTIKEMGQVEQVLDAYIQGGELAALALIKDFFVPEEEKGEFTAFIGWITLNIPRLNAAFERLVSDIMVKSHEMRMKPENLERDRQWFKQISK